MEESRTQRAEQDSLAPIQLDRLTIEEEAAFMNRGKKRQLLFAASLIAMALLGANTLVKQLDREMAYSQAGQAVSDAQQQQLGAYLQCALPGTQLSSVASADELHSAIERLVERFHKDYGRLLKRCEPKLEALAPTLANVNVPKDLQGELHELRASAKQLTASAVTLRTYLEDERTAYDYAQATAYIDRVAKAKLAYDEQDATFARSLDAAR
jgi:hypothetical protein